MIIQLSPKAGSLKQVTQESVSAQVQNTSRGDFTASTDSVSSSFI